MQLGKRARWTIRAAMTLSVVLSLGATPAAASTTFDVTNSGQSAYVIGGVNNPTLTLTRGQTYVFNVTASGHPFWITTVRGAGDAEANAFNQGVTANGSSPGMVAFLVPPTCPGTFRTRSL
jgi:hypothetical protein